MSSDNIDGSFPKRRWYNMEDYDEVPHVHVQYRDEYGDAYPEPYGGYDGGFDEYGDYDDGENDLYDTDWDPEDDEGV